jgi:hypothetical protein
LRYHIAQNQDLFGSIGKTKYI